MFYRLSSLKKERMIIQSIISINHNFACLALRKLSKTYIQKVVITASEKASKKCPRSIFIGKDSISISSS